jgi:hypothetical protein
MDQDLRKINAYVLSVVSLVIALFIPFSFFVLRIFKLNALFATLIVLGIGVPLIALIVGVLGFIKISKSNPLVKYTKILSIISVIISIIVIIFDLYIFVKAKNL